MHETDILTCKSVAGLGMQMIQLWIELELHLRLVAVKYRHGHVVPASLYWVVLDRLFAVYRTPLPRRGVTFRGLRHKADK